MHAEESTLDRSSGYEPSTQGGPNDPAAPPIRQTAVWVSHLPLEATSIQLAHVSSRAGSIAKNKDDSPRIRLCHDELGHFVGYALVVYARAESVKLAILLFENTRLEWGSGPGNMMAVQTERVREEEAKSGQRIGDGQLTKLTKYEWWMETEGACDGGGQQREWRR